MVMSDDFEYKAYERLKKPIPATRAIGIDSIIWYMAAQADKEGIQVQVIIDDDGYDEIRELPSILGELIENAIIAEINSKTKLIEIKFRNTDGVFCADVLDTGEPFYPIVYDRIGIEKVSMYYSVGHKGFGMEIIFDALKKTNASLEIDEMCEEPFTKRVSVCFDSLQQIRINSNRDIVNLRQAKRPDIVWGMPSNWSGEAI